MSRDTWDVRLAYYNGLDRLAITGRFRNKAGATTERTAFIEAETIVRLAAYLSPVLEEPDAGARGHAFYHFDNPGSPYPCEQCPVRARVVIRAAQRRRAP